MKTARKLTTLLLVLAMLFSLCASAGAANAQTATLTVTYGGEVLLDETISTGITAKSALDEYVDFLELEWTTLNYPSSSTTDYAISAIYGISNEPAGVVPGIQVVFWSTTHPGYGLEYTETIDDKLVYHYIYVGYEWNFTVNGAVPENCTQVGDRFIPEYLLNRYIIQPGDSLNINYDFIVHRWESKSNLLTD